MTSTSEARDTRPRRSRRKSLLLALPLLLLIAILLNLGSIMKIVRGEQNIRSIIYGVNKNSGNRQLAGWTLPNDTGSNNAKVTIEVFLRAGDPCHVSSSFIGQALGTIDPQRIRVKFVDAALGKAAIERREQVKLGCNQGIAVNGKTEFQIPDPAAPGKKKTVFTAHQHGAEGPSQALYPILDQELKAQYHGKGLPLTQAQFDEKLKSEIEAFHQIALEKAKLRKQTQSKR